MTCYYCLHNIKDKKCELDVEGYPLPASTECRHFEFDSGPPNEDDIDFLDLGEEWYEHYERDEDEEEL